MLTSGAPKYFYKNKQQIDYLFKIPIFKHAREILILLMQGNPADLTFF